ncbi:MAG TPA: FprA family A-type flavoprotein [bacterium]|jgi:flavorubredoxin
MDMRTICDDVFWLGAIDWERQLFDALVPLPEGTSYNAYLVRGNTKTALLDTVEPDMVDVLLNQLRDVERIDYVVVHHAEQDHSGSLPVILEKYPDAKVVTSAKCLPLLRDLYPVDPARCVLVKDGDTLDLGGRTLEFIFTPWVHWPETMVSYLREDGVLFTCDFFGSHLATSDLFAHDRPRVYDAARRYYAQIMMPFRSHITKHLERLAPLKARVICPSHGPVFDDAAFIMDAYRDWVIGEPKKQVVIPYVSMHHSTKQMVDMLVAELAQRNIPVQPFEMTVTDIGRLAAALVDASTVVMATPTVLNGAHPNVAYAAFLVNLLKPKTKYLSVIGSLGWGGKVVEQLAAMLPNLNVEMLSPVLVKGVPGPEARTALAALAQTIADKHQPV